MVFSVPLGALEIVTMAMGGPLGSGFGGVLGVSPGPLEIAKTAMGGSSAALGDHLCFFWGLGNFKAAMGEPEGLWVGPWCCFGAFGNH